MNADESQVIGWIKYEKGRANFGVRHFEMLLKLQQQILEASEWKLSKSQQNI